MARSGVQSGPCRGTTGRAPSTRAKVFVGRRPSVTPGYARTGRLRRWSGILAGADAKPYAHACADVVGVTVRRAASRPDLRHQAREDHHISRPMMPPRTGCVRSPTWHASIAIHTITEFRQVSAHDLQQPACTPPRRTPASPPTTERHAALGGGPVDRATVERIQESSTCWIWVAADLSYALLSSFAAGVLLTEWSAVVPSHWAIPCAHSQPRARDGRPISTHLGEVLGDQEGLADAMGHQYAHLPTAVAPSTSSSMRLITVTGQSRLAAASGAAHQAEAHAAAVHGNDSHWSLRVI